MNLLTLEWLKLKKNRLFKIIMIIIAAIMPLSIVAIKKMGIRDPLSDADFFYTFPKIWEIVGYIGSWMVFLLGGFLIIQWITAEIRYKTMRQNIMIGVTRHNYWLSKIILITLISIFCTLVVTITGAILGTIYSGEGTSFSLSLAYVGRFFLMCMGYLSFAFLMALLLKRSGIAIICYIMYGTIFENIIRYMIHQKLVKNETMHYYPMNSLEDLMPIPVNEVVEEFVKTQGFDFFLSMQTAIILSIIYTSVFLVLSYIRTRKMNI